MDRVGFSKINGAHYLIGIGPEAWLRARLHQGAELLVREVTPQDLIEPAPERDLSGASFR